LLTLNQIQITSLLELLSVGLICLEQLLGGIDLFDDGLAKEGRSLLTLGILVAEAMDQRLAIIGSNLLLLKHTNYLIAHRYY
jgi:hypothetical protein